MANDLELICTFRPRAACPDIGQPLAAVEVGFSRDNIIPAFGQLPTSLIESRPIRRGQACLIFPRLCRKTHGATHVLAYSSNSR
jgi:hypothetical protein